MMQSSAESGSNNPRGPEDEPASADSLSADLIGILDTVDVPIVVIGRDCKIARFNPAATEMLGLVPSDVGRHPRNIRALTEMKDFEKLCAQVVADGVPSRHYLPNADQWFLVRIAPYKGSDCQIDGAVLTFANVTALRESITQAVYEREYTKAILNTISDALVVLDAELRVQTANRAFFTMFGVSREETVGVPLSNLGDQHWKNSRLWSSLKAILSENSEFRTVEVEHDFPAGRRTLLLDARRLSQEGDTRDIILLALHNITERKQAEEAVRRRSAQYQTLLNQAPLGVYLVDADFRIQALNPIARLVFGDIPELIGRDFDEVVHMLWRKEYADEIVRLFRHTLLTGESYEMPEQIERRIDRAVKEYYEWRIDRIPLAEGGYGVVCYFRDISGQVNARTAIAESEERFRSLVSVITDVPWSSDADGRFVTPQPAWSAFTGQSWAELREFGWVNALHPEDRENFRTLWERACETRSVYKSHGRIWHAPSQRYRHFEARATPLLAADGAVREWVGSCTDIHERKTAEEALRELNAELEDRVAQRTAELVNAIAEREMLNDQLLQAQKMESIGTLAGGIAHDFNNLLNIIMSYSVLIERKLRAGELSEPLAVIRETVQRAAALTQQLLAISRKTEIKFEELNVNAVLEKLKKLLSETFPKAIDIVLDLHPAIPSLIGDPNHIHQVLLNLCVNARDAMPEGGKLFVQTSIVAGAEVRKRFEQAKNDLYVRIQLADTGTGIDDATRNRIFEQFFTTKSQGQGTGLGLAVVYGIVTNHSGFIDVESEPGKGTTFSIYLPASNNNKIFAEEQKSLNNEKRAIGSGEVVLFVDDEERQLRLMQRFLTDAGYRVLVARDGIEAVEIHGQHSNEIAVAVLDLQLPKLNGWEAFQKMKLLQPNLQAIFATGFVSAEIEAEIAHAQRGKIIMKPYDLTEVLENVSAAARKPLLNNEGELGRD